MQGPIDRVRGRIVDVDPNGILTIKCKYDNWHLLFKRDYSEAYVELIDGRKLSDRQRKACFAMIGEIAEWMGQGRTATQRDLVKEGRKIDFLVNELGENADRIFSLSNAPMSLVAAFQKYLVRFIIENDVPCKMPLYEYADDIGDYVYYCVLSKKCVVCGRHADLHHVDRVGMGADRQDIIHEGLEVLSVCREHHTEIHTTGDSEFSAKYHIDGGVIADKSICKLYRIKAKKQA